MLFGRTNSIYSKGKRLMRLRKRVFNLMGVSFCVEDS